MAAIKFNPNFDKQIDAKARRCLGLAAEAVRGMMVRNISIPTRTQGPSAHGEYPHADAGTLRKSHFSHLIDNDTAMIGSTAKHSLWLEEGTSKMAARPYMRRSLFECKSIVDAILGSAK